MASKSTSLLIFLFVLFSLLGNDVLKVEGSRCEIKEYGEKTISLKMSNVLEGNILPSFLFLQGSEEGGSTEIPIGGGRGKKTPFIPDDSCPDDIFEFDSQDLRSPQLPYLTQDQWTCDRIEEKVPTLSLETDSLSAMVTPQFGGKIWKLWDKKRKRDILFANPAHQPANIGALKAWTSGGCEFNWSPGIIGHSAFTESPVWAAKVETDLGDILRIYEFDRYNQTTWQVDIFLDDNETLWIHPKVRNPTGSDLFGYWWTCVAFSATPQTRILAPGISVVEQEMGGMRGADWPLFSLIENTSFSGLNQSWITDNSYLGNSPGHADFFIRIPSPRIPYIAHVAEQGNVAVHGHTLNGTKFFTWGQNGPGRFWQDFLAANPPDRMGDYTELQVGVAPTQMQVFPFKSHTDLEWTEWIKPFIGDEVRLHSRNYSEAVGVVNGWMESGGMTVEEISKMNKFLESHSDDPVDKKHILSTGSPWGAVHEKATGQRITPALYFDTGDSGTLADIWLDLLHNGTFSPDSLKWMPTSYMVNTFWIDQLQKSADTHGYTWLHHLLLGVAFAESGGVSEPVNHFQASLQMKAENPIALRCLAVLTPSNQPRDALTNWLNAWLAADGSEDPSRKRLLRNLASEICLFLQGMDWLDELKAFLDWVPPFLENLDQVITSRIKVAISSLDFEKALKLLSDNCFPTYAKARSELMQMWQEAQIGKVEKERQQPLTPREKHDVRINNPIPRNIGCAYGSRYCSNYW